MSATDIKKSILQRQTVPAMVVDRLREQILSHEIPEGAQLRQDNLAAAFGVSRIPVREALLQLEGEGLVRQVAHKGYSVTALSVDEIREEFDLRALIETDLLRRAIPHFTSADEAAARAVLATFDTLLTAGREEAEWAKLNWKLHAALYAPAGRLRTMRILENLHRSGDRYLRLQLKLTRVSKNRAREEHGRLVDLCAARDVAEATRLVNEHILHARDELVRFLSDRRAAAGDSPAS